MDYHVAMHGCTATETPGPTLETHHGAPFAYLLLSTNVRKGPRIGWEEPIAPQLTPQGCRHQGGFGSFSPPDFETLIHNTMLVGVVTKTRSILSRFLPHILKCVYAPAPTIGLGGLCSQICLLWYSLMLTNSTHYAFISAHYTNIMLEYPHLITGKENNYN